MRNILVIRNADFSSCAVEKVNIITGDAPTILFALNGVVSIAAADGDIYYTTNGTTPTTDSTKYTGTFTVSGGTTVKAIAVGYGGVSDVASATFNAGGASILYKQNYTLGFATQSSTTLTEIAMTGYGITDYIPVPSFSDLNVNFGANIQALGMWNEYYKFKIVEYDSSNQITIAVDTQRYNEYNTPTAPIGNTCIWSVREGTNVINYKNVLTQSVTKYIRFVVKLDTSANVVDKNNNNNVLFQYIPD